MRLIELTLFVWLFVSGYSGYGQDVVKNEKSVAPILIQTPAKTAAPAAPAESSPKMDILLPRNIELIIGKTEETGYLPRLKAIHQLGKDLQPGQLEALYDFLYTKLEKQGLPSLEFNALKNDIVIVLMKQRIRQNALAGHLVKMYNDKSFDSVWRDYCIQFMGQWYEYSNADDMEQIRKALSAALTEKQSSISGTALNALKDLAKKKFVDRKEISNIAYNMLSDKDQSDLNKTTALQVCVSLDDRRALPAAREIVGNSRNVTLKMSAIAVLGAFGDRSDLEQLNKCLQSTDVRLKIPAQAAIARINKAYKLSN